MKTKMRTYLCMAASRFLGSPAGMTSCAPTAGVIAEPSGKGAPGSFAVAANSSSLGNCENEGNSSESEKVKGALAPLLLFCRRLL